MNMAHLRERIECRAKRFLAEHFAKRVRLMNNPGPLISFSFDDFPRSSLIEGGAILRSNGFRGTYYASLGLMGKNGKVGEMFIRSDLDKLQSQGHELGCHTAEHLNPWSTSPIIFEASVYKNSQLVCEIIPELTFKSFSYPFAYPSPRVKKKVAGHFECCRCGGQKNNKEKLDANLLNAFFLEFSRGDLKQVQDLVNLNTESNGWLIFVTHDISNRPSVHGCTPTFFDQVVHISAASGATILPVIEAYSAISSKRLV